MFAYVKGCLVSISPVSVVIEANGIGYEIFIPVSHYSKLPPLNEQVQLFTSFVIRENSQSLYGFLTRTEKELYELLLSVSGIGPKLGMALVGHLSVHELQHAVGNADLFTLSKVPGVGKRTAERIVLELKDKIQQFSPRDFASTKETVLDSKNQIMRDAANALINLGYTQQVAQKAIQKAAAKSDDLDLAGLITSALALV